MRSQISRRHLKEFLLGGAATYGALWLIIESLSAFLPSLKPEGIEWYGAFLGLSVLGGAWRAWPTKQIEFEIPGSDSSFEIRFGDVFCGDSVVVLPVNEYFDGELGDHVSKESLHGQFIWNVLGGHAETFFFLTRKALSAVEPRESGVPRSSGQRDRYAIGTFARVEFRDRHYLLVALSHTDVVSLKASATVQDLWASLEGIWTGVRQYASGKAVRVPLVGSGLSGIGLPPSNLIEIIITSFLYHTKEQKVADKVTLVLPSRLARKIDLKNIRRSWS